MFKKQHIALLLFALVSIKTLLVPVVYLDFELRKEYIIKNLCENRFQPQLHCDGKCYLAKRLHKLAEDNATKETQKHASLFKKMVEDLFEELNLDFNLPVQTTITFVICSVPTNFLLPKHAQVPIKPPIG
ncbi:MAG: hypothetical protein LCH91_29285 [Bacteroidetes bacterium]|nr:hypothetical protein [Bacteroidota bacterium]